MNIREAEGHIVAAKTEQLKEALEGISITDASKKSALIEDERPFDPRTEVSADAKYLWTRIFAVFCIAPIVLALIAAVLWQMFAAK